MLRIVTHIERLLLIHDCIIIPQFGGFVLQYAAAARDTDTALFQPFRKVISFNATLQHTDGLLNESYRELYDLNYQQAQTMLEQDVAELQHKLVQFKKVSLGKLGSFTLNEEAQPVFESGTFHEFCLAAYGLPAFHMKPLAALTDLNEPLHDQNSKQTDIYYLPIRRRWLKLSGAVAAAAALFFLISTPVKEVNHSVYKASFIPSSSLYAETTAEADQYSEAASVFANALINPSSPDSEIQPETVATATASKAAESKSESMINAEVASSALKAPDAASAITTKVVAADTKTEVAAPAVKPAKTYYIIIASFPSAKQAATYLDALKAPDGLQPRQIERDGKFRISANQFDNRPDAEHYMHQLRENPDFKDAWLFVSR